MKTAIITLALFVLLHATAGAADGNKLLTNCNAAIAIIDSPNIANDSFGAGLCIGLMQGIRDTASIYQSHLIENLNVDRKKVPMCIPTGVSNGQLARVVVKHLRDHPEQLHMHDSFLAMNALMKTFHCQS
jgi:hypothetical protein